jgi:hypothetical protein
MMKFNRWVFGFVFAICFSVGHRMAFAFNLWHDIQEKTEWTLGDVAAAGTAINLRNGDLAYSALAEIGRYRFLSGWYGGTKVNKTDENLTDSAKIGFNLNYIFKGFVNKPPKFIDNLVVGPSYAISLLSSPRQGTPFFDINYSFGGGSK